MTVTGCDDCPLKGTNTESESSYGCSHPDLGVGEKWPSRPIHNPLETPSWCPLRAADLLVHLVPPCK